MKLFALLIGINEYSLPSSDPIRPVRKLPCCRKKQDVIIRNDSLPCHHLNYFVTPVSVKALAEAIE